MEVTEKRKTLVYNLFFFVVLVHCLFYTLISSTTMSTPIPVLYDETSHDKSRMDPQVISMGNFPNLLGYLERHGPDTDGSFTICELREAMQL